MKKYIALLQIVIIGSLLAITFQYVFASRPSTPPDDNGIELVHENSIDEYKAGGLKIGDGSVASPILTTGYKLDIRGSIYSTGISVIKASGGTGGNMSVTGTITNDALAGSGPSNVCADSTGALIRC